LFLKTREIDSRFDTRLHDEENRFLADGLLLLSETDHFLNGVPDCRELIQAADLSHDGLRIKIRLLFNAAREEKDDSQGDEQGADQDVSPHALVAPFAPTIDFASAF
jgi:hypothetical protein